MRTSRAKNGVRFVHSTVWSELEVRLSFPAPRGFAAFHSHRKHRRQQYTDIPVVDLLKVHLEPEGLGTQCSETGPPHLPDSYPPPVLHAPTDPHSQPDKKVMQSLRWLRTNHESFNLLLEMSLRVLSVDTCPQESCLQKLSKAGGPHFLTNEEILHTHKKALQRGNS